MSIRLPACWLLLAVALLPSRAGAFAPIAVTVREPDGLARHRWPLTVSVPFAHGELQPGTAVKMIDERGAPAPVQTRPLVTWPDGSVRWLTVDTQVDLAPHRQRRLRLEVGRAPAPAATARVTETGDGLLIDTGVIRFTVPKTRFAILEALSLHGGRETVIGALRGTLAAGVSAGDAQPPTAITVRENGPLRVRVELQGTYGSGFDYIVRLEAYAGQPFVRIWHTFINRHPTPYVSIDRLGVELSLPEPHPSQYRYGIVGRRPTTGHLSDAALRLYQADNASYAVGDATRAGKLAGWIELDGARATVGLAARWMWEEYPQSLAAQRDRLVYNLWAPEAGPANAGVGAAKTHEFVVWAAAPRALPSGASQGMKQPLRGIVDPVWMARSGALPQAVAPLATSASFVRKVTAAARHYAERNAVERWDDCGAVRCDAAAERPRDGAYGMWNWGDWNFDGYHDTIKGTDSWGNLEYDTAYVLALTAAASGDAGLYEMLVAAARHFIDVDTIHACPARPNWVGMNHPKDPLHFAFELGGPDLGHTWTQGSLAYYYLTGDERGLAAARAIADYLTERAHHFTRGNPRQWGWPQIALLAVFDATGERKYLDAALVYARGGMSAHPPAASTQWKLGILADALAYTHAATGDAAIKSWLEQYAAAVMQRIAHEDVRAFPAVAYVAALDANPAMRAAAHVRVEHLELGTWGKPYSVNGRIGFRIESLLAAPAPDEPPVRQDAHVGQRMPPARRSPPR